MKQSDITTKEEKVTLPVTKRKRKVLFEHIESIIEMVVDSGLKEDFFTKAKVNIRYVAKKMDLTPNQAVLLSAFIEHSDDQRIGIRDLSKFMGCRKIKMIGFSKDIEELEKRRLIRCSRSDESVTYRVPLEVVDAIKQNSNYFPESAQNLSINDFFKHLNRMFNERENNEISYKRFIMELRTLVDDNLSLKFCIQIKKIEECCNSEDIYPLLLFFCHRFVNLDDDSIGIYEFSDLFDDPWVLKRIKMSFGKGKNDLLTLKIIENTFDNGFKDSDCFRITFEAKNKLFSELDIISHQTEMKKGLIEHTKIIHKQLFFNERVQWQIQQLSSLLENENFRSIQENLVKNGMRKGFACLFHGMPGTGKTETVYQIARSTGRDILMVDIAETKSMWYGESEKRIKQIFDSYRSYLENSEKIPILLFNEADAVIGKRKETGNSSINQTENAIQNILLQEMENLEGIMIATTNLTQNIDKAFERRFLYKIEFDKPCVEIKAKIWNTMLPSLTEEDRLILANNYDFSGGQIENIVRKYTVDCILNGTAPNINTIHGYCQSEFLNNRERKKIGFTV